MSLQQTRIRLKTLTPLWTGGPDTKVDRLHETGIIGSLRWWYEAIVRGLEGYACDLTASDRCELSGKEKSEMERLQKLCPACYLFGCGGWRRRFRLDVVPTVQNCVVPIHFRTTLKSNQNWLGRIFHGVPKEEGRKEEYDLTSVNVYYWEDFTDALSFRFVSNDVEYIRSQIEGLVSFIGEFGFLSAKPQHGFGQVAVDGLNGKWRKSFRSLYDRINTVGFSKGSEQSSHLPSLHQAVFLSYDVPKQEIERKFGNDSHYGANTKSGEMRYIPCSFDLRYKCQDDLGFRVWLEKDLFCNKPTKEEKKKLDPLLGAVGRKGYPITDKDREGSRIFFGMPVRNENERDEYSLRIVGFLPHGFSCLGDVSDLGDKISEYMGIVFPKSELSASYLGRDVVAEIKQGGAL